MSEQYTLPKPTIWRLKDEDATEHYGKPIHVYYDGADLRLDHPDIKKMTALLEPLFRSEQVREAVAHQAAEARSARIAAQTENEALKARIAASGVAERRAVHEAVLAEREACAKVCHDEGVYQLSQQGNAIMADKCWFMRDEIRARGAT